MGLVDLDRDRFRSRQRQSRIDRDGPTLPPVRRIDGRGNYLELGYRAGRAGRQTAGEFTEAIDGLGPYCVEDRRAVPFRIHPTGFAKDAKVGQTNGEGVEGTWFAVSATGAKIVKKAAAKAPASAPASGGYGN